MFIKIQICLLRHCTVLPMSEFANVWNINLNLFPGKSANCNEWLHFMALYLFLIHWYQCIMASVLRYIDSAIVILGAVSFVIYLTYVLTQKMFVCPDWFIVQ